MRTFLDSESELLFRIVLDSVREKFCSGKRVEHNVVPISIHQVGNSGNTGPGQPYNTQYVETAKGSTEMQTFTKNDFMG